MRKKKTKTQSSDIERNKLIKNRKTIGIDDIIKQNDRIYNNEDL